MLVLVFVLLIVLVFEQRDPSRIRRRSRLCPVLRETVEQMNFRGLAQQIDCELVSDPEKPCEVGLRFWAP